MKKYLKKHSTLMMLLVCLVVFQTGCASTTIIPLVENKQVHFMPIVDARKDKTEIIDTPTVMSGTAKRNILLKGYDLIVCDDFSDKEEIDPRYVAEMDFKELAKLGPDNAKKLLYVFLNDLDTNYFVIYKTIKFDISVLLIQKNPEEILWREKIVTSKGSWGVVNALLVDKNHAFGAVITALFEEMPQS